MRDLQKIFPGETMQCKSQSKLIFVERLFFENLNDLYQIASSNSRCRSRLVDAQMKFAECT